MFKRMLKYFEKYNEIDYNKACNIILENLIIIKQDIKFSIMLYIKEIYRLKRVHKAF